MNAMASDVCQAFRTAKLPRKNGKDMKAFAQSLRDIGDIPASDLTW